MVFIPAFTTTECKQAHFTHMDDFKVSKMPILDNHHPAHSAFIKQACRQRFLGPQPPSSTLSSPTSSTHNDSFDAVV
jgi:hypothetical protein